MPVVMSTDWGAEDGQYPGPSQWGLTSEFHCPLCLVKSGSLTLQN